MSKIDENAKIIKKWLEHLDFEHEHPGYGQDIYKKLDEIINECQLSEAEAKLKELRSDINGR